jgi:hypothetical protein
VPPDKTGKKQGRGDVVTRFQPGASGNPGGRPKGARNRATKAAQDLLDGASGELVAALIEKARAGHPVALKLCIERIVPRAGHAVEIDLPAVRKAGDIATAVASVIEGCARGELTIEEADRIMSMLDRHRAALATDELLLRVAALEEDELLRGLKRRIS